ncbi:serine carboxypeptidase [Clavulina sp. PMI_390]|nr:serine carboxypeptidase [Clavulina sp. PMI_390]
MLLASVLLGSIALNGLCLHVSASTQRPLDTVLGAAEALQIDTVPTDIFTTFTHPSLPSHSLRIKQHTNFCDTTVRSYTGYLDAAYGTQHLFFYYFESRHDPKTDPVVIWLNGGPGCSSTSGLFMENGPCRVNKHGNATSYNDYGWNDRANLIFIDQPVNTGFSYSDHSIDVFTTTDAARTIQDFVRLFFEAFPDLKGRPLHLSGESYAGRYIPVFAAAILDGNEKLNSSHTTPINLQSVAIGNGAVNMPQMVPSIYRMLCTHASVAPVLNVEQCVDLKHRNTLCQKKVDADCKNKPTQLSCAAAVEYCMGIIVEALVVAEKNPYDLTKVCDQPSPRRWIFPQSLATPVFLTSVQDQLGIPTTFGRFKGCSSSVGSGFLERGDHLISSQFHLEQLIERGVRVLMYDGVLDAYANRIGYLGVAESLEWSGQAEFTQKPLSPWFTSTGSGVALDPPAGHVKTVRKKNSIGGESVLSWVEIDGSGHMVPFDKPLEALVMINKWLADEEL